MGFSEKEMKTLILILICVGYLHPQGNTIPLQLDSVKNKNFTFRGQKNFTGTVKFGSDTLSSLRRNLLTLGKHHPTLTTQGVTINPYYGNSSNWNWDTYEDTTLNSYGDTIPVWTVFALGYNWDNANTGDVRSALVMENNYWINYSTPEQTRIYDTEIYFAWTDSNDVGNQLRPLAFNLSRGTRNSTGGLAVNEFYITDNTRKNWIIMQPANDIIYLIDTMSIIYQVNNTPLIYQNGTSAVFNNPVEVVRVDDDNDISLGVGSWSQRIKLNKPVYFPQSSEPDYDSSNVLMYNEEGALKVKDGFGQIRTISKTVLPSDTSGLSPGDQYFDVSTGNVKVLVPENLLSNGDFETWTNGYSPDDWTASTPDTTNFYYENDGGKLHFIMTDPSSNPQVYQGGGTAGTYGYSFVVTQIVDTFRVSIGLKNNYITEIGYYTGTADYVSGVLASIGTQPGFISGASEITIDNFRVWDINGAIATTSNPITGLDAGNWKVFYSDGSGVINELSLGAAGTVLKSNGTSFAPTFQSDATGAGGSAYADSVTINGRHVPGDSLYTIDEVDAIVLTYVDSNYVLTSETSNWDKSTSDDLTTGTSFGGDVSGSYNSIAVTDDSHNHVIGNVDALQDSLTAKANTAWFAVPPTLIDDSLTVKMNRSEMSGYASASHTHTEFLDTIPISWATGFGNNAIDTITTGEVYGIKLPYNCTFQELSASTNQGTVTFNVEIRGETTPNTAGTDIISSDLVADNNQEETTTFSTATATRNQRLTLVISAVSGDPTIFGATLIVTKTN